MLVKQVRFLPESGPVSALAFMSASDPRQQSDKVCDSSLTIVSSNINRQKETMIGPLSYSDGHNSPRLVNQLVLSEAAMVNDVVVGCEYSV
ncbi:MAG: hypothetical protein HQ494_03650 [Rhodospirillales bacterium]|nr:hypothetical protein [Rhodospirillales bacterium]